MIFTKADKGNAVVILDKSDYDNRVYEMLSNGPYKEIIWKNGNPRNPINQMILSTKETTKKVCSLLQSPGLRYKFNTPNPKVAQLYALPKIHKIGNQMRPISANLNTPMGKMSQWLVNQLNKIKDPPGANIKNNLDLVDRIQHVKLEPGEIMVSFDVTALFPSVPIPFAISFFVEHLKNEKVPDTHIQAYEEIMRLCMDQNFFQFRGKFYQQTSGTCMGSKLAPYISNIFMSRLETDLKTSFRKFPRVWWRYVDDIFAILKEEDINEVLDHMNSLYPSIQFTIEKEKNGCIPFLDIEIKRKENGQIKFGIYRKPTNTKRFITSDSHHNLQHKAAAFHCLAHRLFSIPMEKEDFEKERVYIHEVAKINGYSNEWTNKIINKHESKHRISKYTQLTKIETEKEMKRVCVPYYPQVTNKLKKVLRDCNIQLVTKSSSIGRSLCNFKDKEESHLKSGIYKIECDSCDQVYIGQTSRDFKTRLNEHKQAIENNFPNKSAVAEHMLKIRENENFHNIDFEKSKLIKIVNDNWKLDAYETLYMTKENQLINLEDAPISGHLFSIFQNDG